MEDGELWVVGWIECGEGGRSEKQGPCVKQRGHRMKECVSLDGSVFVKRPHSPSCVTAKQWGIKS